MRRSCGPAGTSSSANRPSGLVRVPRFVPTTDTSALGMGAPLAAAVTRPSTRPPWAAASSAEEAKPRAMTRAPGMQLMRVFLWRPASAEEHTTAARRAAESLAPGRSYLRSEEHTSELQSQSNIVCRLLLEQKNIESSYFFFFNDTATTEIYTLSLHDALPILGGGELGRGGQAQGDDESTGDAAHARLPVEARFG